MKKSWTNSKRLERNDKPLSFNVREIPTQEILDVMDILEDERKRIIKMEYARQRMAFRMRNPYQTPKRVHQGRASRLIKRALYDCVNRNITPDEALQILCHDEVEQARRETYFYGL